MAELSLYSRLLQRYLRHFRNLRVDKTLLSKTSTLASSQKSFRLDSEAQNRQELLQATATVKEFNGVVPSRLTHQPIQALKSQAAKGAQEEAKNRGDFDHQNSQRPSYRRRHVQYLSTEPVFAATTCRNSVRPVLELAAFKSLFTLNEASGDRDKELEMLFQGPFETHCISVLPGMNLDDALLVADFWFSTPGRKMNYKVPQYHRKFLEKISTWTSEIAPFQALQALFYCAVYRKITHEVEAKLMKIIVNNVDKLDLKAVELLAFSSYILKTDFRNNSAVVAKISEKFLLETSDTISAVTVLKFLRQNNFMDPLFFRRLSEKFASYDFTESNGVESCHIIQAFVSARFYDETLFNRLQTKILEKIELQMKLYETCSNEDLLTRHPSERIRTKDIANFLLSLSVINHPIQQPELIFSDLRKRLQAQEFLDTPYFLVQSVYAMSMQGFYDTELLDAVFSAATIKRLAGWKDAQRWAYSLYKNCHIEFPAGLRNANVTEERLASGLPKDFDNVGYEMRFRNEDLIHSLKKTLQERFGKEAVHFKRQIPHVEVCGFDVRVLTGQDVIEKMKNPGDVRNLGTCKKIAVEILDDWTSAVNIQYHPLGNVVLKTRLLKLLGWSTEIKVKK